MWSILQLNNNLKEISKFKNFRYLKKFSIAIPW